MSTTTTDTPTINGTDDLTSALYLSRLRLNLRHPRIMRSLGDAQALHQLVMSLFPAVESDAARAAMAILYRVDEAQPIPGRVGTPDISTETMIDVDPILLIQSTVPPRLIGAESAAARDTGPVWVSGMIRDDTGLDDTLATRDVATIFSKITDGQRLGFRLRANPTKRLSLTRPDDPAYADQGPDRLLTRHRDDGKGTGPRVALLRPAEHVQWLVRQGERHGFALVPQDRTWVVAEGPEEPTFVLTTASIRTGGVRGPRKDKLVHNAVTFDGELTVTDADAFRAALRTGIGPAKAYGFGLLSVRPPR